VNGNMTSFTDKGISSVQYNFLNLPRQITRNSVDTQYTYRADGVKLKKLFGTVETNYLDGFQYKFTSAWEDPSGTMTNDEMKLRIIPNSEGYFDALRNKYFYNYTDHLGNVRLSYSDADGNGEVTGDITVNNCVDTPDGQICNNYVITGEVEGVTNYYPFGMMHNAQSYNVNNIYNYKYNGKELQETGMYDYGARFYMPDIGRWGVIDNKAEKYLSMSPYTYAGNNPIAFMDPDGNELILSFATDTARQSYQDLVKSSLGGKYKAVYTKIEGTDTYKVTLNMVNKDASLTKEQQAFYDSYNDVVGAKEIVNQEVVENDKQADGGNFQTGKLDIADILEFDKAGKGGTSSAGLLTHEHIEQLEKAKMGIPKGKLGKVEKDESGNIVNLPDFNKAHEKGKKAEDKVNGNKRIETDGPMSINLFEEKDRTKTNQAIWPKDDGGITVKKTKLP